MPLSPHTLLMGAPAAAPSWTPASLGSNLKAWWDFTDTATITGSSVTAVTDKSGNGFTLTASSTARPTTGTRTINSLNVLDFDGTANILTLASNPLSGATAASCFYVMANDNDPGVGSPGAVLADWGTVSLNCHEPYSDGNVYTQWGQTSRTTVGNPTPSLTTPRQIDMWVAASDFSYNIDGTAVNTSSPTVGWGSSPHVGGGLLGGSYFFNGRIAEIFVVNAKLTGTNLTSARGYLKTKFATA